MANLTILEFLRQNNALDKNFQQFHKSVNQFNDNLNIYNIDKADKTLIYLSQQFDQYQQLSNLSQDTLTRRKYSFVRQELSKNIPDKIVRLKKQGLALSQAANSRRDSSLKGRISTEKSSKKKGTFSASKIGHCSKHPLKGQRQGSCIVL